MQESIQAQGHKELIVMVFNLGVWLKQQKEDASDVSAASEELKGIIYWNLKRQYGDALPSDVLRTSVEYFLNIALLGFILPEVCLPDEELKGRLLVLMEAKANGAAPPQTIGQRSNVSAIHN